MKEAIKKIISGLGALCVIAVLALMIVSNIGKKDKSAIPQNVGEAQDDESNSVDDSYEKKIAESYSKKDDSASRENEDTTEAAETKSSTTNKESLFKRDLGEGGSKKVKKKATVTPSDKSSSSNSGNSTEDDISVSEDHNNPKFLTFTRNPKINIGNEFDVHNFMGYGDNLDRDVQMTITGTVDTSTLGSYPITITLKDDAGNTCQSDMTVSVVTSGGYEPASKDDGTPSAANPSETFAEFKEKYKGEKRSFGIDVSRWQGSIDFNKVKAAGCDFAILRLGGFDDGNHYTDRQYTTYIADAKAAGLKIGIYWHAEERNPDEVKKSVEYLDEVLNGEKLDFPIAYDWEDFEGFEDYGMNFSDINKCYDTFYDEVNALGYEACLYSSLNFLENVWTNNKNGKVWLAHYTSQTDYTGPYYMWQQTSSGGIDGVITNVDFNVCYE
ncbi:MAG: hypothetical protein J5684_07565 [Eubacterium sp.]|nr:hypothetical protein [Eubacterium sp.]